MTDDNSVMLCTTDALWFGDNAALKHMFVSRKPVKLSARKTILCWWSR